MFTKEQTLQTMSSFAPYYLSPVFSYLIALLVWLVVPFEMGFISFKMSLVFSLSYCCSLGVYPTMGADWVANSKYSLLCFLHSVAQAISFEVSLTLIFFSGLFDLGLLTDYQR